MNTTGVRFIPNGLPASEHVAGAISFFSLKYPGGDWGLFFIFQLFLITFFNK